jgi:UDP:flavonoid glycosyltransferase YjiC (YdhE family)
MRILFVAAGAYGHLYPVIPVALAAQRMGHSVAVATHPSFKSEVDRAGLAAIAAGPSIEGAAAEVIASLTAPPESEADILIKIMELTIPRTVADLEPVLANGNYDLVLHESAVSGTAIAAAKAGVPSAMIGLGRMPDDAMWDIVFPKMAQIFADNGLAVDDPRTMDSPYMDFCPPFLQSPGFPKPGATSILMRPTAWNPPGDLPRAVVDRDPGKPLVYMTLGTASIFAQPAILREMIDAIAGLRVKVVLSTGPVVSADALGAIPDNVEVVAWVPQAELLKHVDLAVHHGGSGTTFAAMAVGIPQLLLPHGADQFSNAQMLSAAGAGGQILPGEVTSARIADEVRLLLESDEARTAARKLQGEIFQMPSMEDAIEQVIALTRP